MTATAVILPPGETLGGYRIRDAIGVGGMAVVYRAEQLSLNREVALKVLSLDLGRDEVFSERFRREGMHVANLDHPNVIPIYDAGEDKGRLFLAMRLVEGMTLAERMRAEPLSADETLQILGPIADGLDAAHASGLVHRDVKPHNILLTQRGHPYLTDFGVAKRVETAGLTATGGFVGSFHYAAPEQVLGTPTSPATDIYALTAVLYQCLTGAVPYARYTDAGVLFAHVNEPPPRLPLTEAREFNRVVERGMAKAPVDRYASAGDLILAVRRCVHDLPSAFARRRPTFFSTSPTGPEDGTVQEHPSSGAGTSPDTPATLGDERRRIPPAPEPTGPETDRERPVFGTRRMVTLAAGLAVLAGAIAGALLIGGGPAAASSRVAHSGALAINYRPPWARTRAAFGAFAVAPSGRTRAPAPIELDSDGATLAAGSLVDSAAIPGGPPFALVTHFGRPTRETSHLASGSSAAVYRWNAVNGRTIAAWIIPTVRGDLAIICSAPVAMTTAIQACAGMATRARVSRVPLLAVGPDVGLARSVRRIVGSADTSRRTLAAAHHGRPATTAAAIARADTRAAALLRKLDVPARYEPMLSRFAAALDAEARAFTALGHARGRRVYAIASGGADSASRDVASISRQAASAGLLVSGLPALSVPRLRAGSTSPSGSPSTSSASTPLAPSVTTTAQPSSPPASTSGSTSGSSSRGSTGSHPTHNSKAGSPIH
jgi:serine/threonine protein kinase